jgi:apolipoprotein N-acyltransferase
MPPASAPPPAAVVRWLFAPAAALAIAVFVAAPWLEQRLAWSAWVGVAAALLLAGRARGWWGEFWTIAGATAAIAAAFHWTPKVLAFALDAPDWVGLSVAAPIVLWDALRLAAPILFVARLRTDPLAAWLPAGLLAVVLEATMPAVFPWKLGYSQIAWPWLVQAVDLFGPEFSTLVLYAHAGLLVWAVHLLAAAGGGSLLAAAARPPRAVVAAAALAAANLAYGAWAVGHWSAAAADAPRIDVALVQANPEEDGGVDSLREQTEAGDAAPAGPPALVCWPECSGGCYDERLDSLADPDRVLEWSRAPNAGMRPLDEPTSPILFGGKFYRGHPDKPKALYQSGILVDPTHAIVGRYHKRHLMPFGEYVPGEDWYPDIKRYFPMQDEFTAGTEPTVLAVGAEARLGVMMCYEDMISGAARSLAASGANLLVSLINGAAFTEPLTLRQHRLLAQLRAVETRRCLLRCAATGETCVVSPAGIVTAAVPLHARETLRADIPLLEGRTLYSRTGRILPWACGLGLALVARRRAAAAAGITAR